MESTVQKGLYDVASYLISLYPRHISLKKGIEGVKTVICGCFCIDKCEKVSYFTPIVIFTLLY